MMRTIALVALLAATPVMAGELSPVVDGKGEISMPENFRMDMVHLGSWFVPEGDASGFHDVYADRKGVEAYRQSGTFPDGTVVVKELRPAASGDFTTGKDVSYSTTDVKQWFVMVKDSKNRFADSPSWGEGWGWALFKPGVQGNQSANYKQDCLGCHVPVKDKDWIYTQGYPTLISVDLSGK
ncbi:cytochrome P460 family protein [Shewanella submarina]|uniref:Cytochrome P460 family protein n=1 Tax=Shewanella submarina TaxID=2016376 RepID=A0ABV7GJE7_9GAMM|nr:cytochrome P460 family protein [Shewanella submarina]MCL1036077.1 cytochrome P460 family protein [Shewanella submarina]